MKAIFKKVVTFALVVLMGVEAVSFAMPAQKVEAASAPVLRMGNEVAFLTPASKTFGYRFEKISSTAKVTITIADKTVASAKYEPKTATVYFTGKKLGSTKVTVNVKQGGKTYKFSAKHKWVKYTNPIKSLTIGTKAYKASYYDKNNAAALKAQTSKKAFTWKLKKGYKINYIYIFRDGDMKEMKNGQSVKFASKDKMTMILLSYTNPDGVYGILWLEEGSKTGPLNY